MLDFFIDTLRFTSRVCFVISALILIVSAVAYQTGYIAGAQFDKCMIWAVGYFLGGVIL